MLQKLYASLEEKELLPESSISASDEYQYESAIYTFEQYGDSLKYIDQINTHGYHSKACGTMCTLLAHTHAATLVILVNADLHCARNPRPANCI